MQETIKKIHELAKEIGREVKLMEVCGSHTEVAAKYGIPKLLPPNIRLITGPGCPVCVAEQSDIDNIIELALAGIPIVTYGDMLKVPGNKMSLEDAKAQGARVFTIYSTEDIFTNPETRDIIDELVFFGVGFDTTTPMTASIVKRGVTIYSIHKAFFPAMESLLQMGEIKIEGFINPGHVSAVIGSNIYHRLDVAQVIAGFKAEDVLLAIYWLLRQIKAGEKKVENEYFRLVKENGNKMSQEMISDVFELADARWRGFGVIPQSAFEIREKYQEFDAKVKYKDILDKAEIVENPKLKLCQCGQVIRGLIEPNQCTLFDKSCNPENPFGPCMVSREGACNVKYRFKQ